MTRTIHANSERSEQFLVLECFFNLFLEVSNKLEQLEIKLEKNIGIEKHAGKVRKVLFQNDSTCSGVSSGKTSKAFPTRARNRIARLNCKGEVFKSQDKQGYTQFKAKQKGKGPRTRLGTKKDTKSKKKKVQIIQVKTASSSIWLRDAKCENSTWYQNGQ